MASARPRRGVYPGSFDPLTVAHVAIAEAAISQLGLDRLDFALSRSAFDKEHLDDSLEQRRAALRRYADHRGTAARPGTRPGDPGAGVTGLGRVEVVVVDARLIAEVARGYDAVVMGADKWYQLHELRFYDHDPRARDRALASLPRVAVAPRDGWTVPEQHRLHLPAEFGEVSATAVRQGRHEWRAGHASD
ncbi:MAG: hypothetical protein KDB24_00885 [Microthrixaceae bacterium]|nr:hypothetical protein [Microthrixaceae bacterium]